MSVTSVQNAAYIRDALKYANGMSVVNDSIVDDVFGAFKSVPSFAMLQGGLYTGGRLLSKTGETTSIFGKTIAKRAGVKGLTSALKDMKTLMCDSKALQDILKANNGLKTAGANLEITKEINTLIKAGKTAEVSKLLKEGKSAETLLKELQSASGSAAAAAKSAEKVSKFSKIATWFKGTSIGGKIVNSSVVSGAKSILTKAAATPVGSAISKGASKFSKAFKGSGAGLNLIIEGGLALFTDVLPAFQLGGAKEGFKQLGKSAVKVGASTAGWVGGSKLGAAAGSAIGTAICPGIGTFIGGLVGDVVGGLIGSAVAGKVAEKVVGEDYTDKIQNQAIDEQATMLASDSSSIAQVNQVVEQLIQEDLADDGKLTKDSEKMLEYLQNGAGTVSSATYLSNYDSTNSSYTSTSSYDLLLQRIKSGDTSVYDVPSDVLSASASKYSSTSTTSEGFANNYTSFGMQNPYATQTTGQTLNYFSA